MSVFTSCLIIERLLLVVAWIDNQKLHFPTSFVLEASYLAKRAADVYSG